MRIMLFMFVLLLSLTACEVVDTAGTVNTVDTARVIRVVDGDTIQVELDGEAYAVRYIGVNTPEIAHNNNENDDACGREATAANRRLVEGQSVRLERDMSDTDQYGRLLRYVYVGNTFVNETLIKEGWAEVVRYAPDSREYNHFLSLEQQAENNGLGCHTTGIFNDGSYTR